MKYNHKLSEKIRFDKSKIKREDFIQFLDILFKLDRLEYASELKDGFLDLFNYWENLGNSRFRQKIKQNSIKIQEFKKKKDGEKQKF